MRTLYLVRHAEKAWKNGRKPSRAEGYQHDPPVKENARIPQETMNQLRDVRFDSVFCSPFLRTRQTCWTILQVLGTQCQVIHRPEIGEYLGNHRRGNPDVHPDTRVHFTSDQQLQRLMSESIQRLHLRVKTFIDSLPQEGTFLIVSHGLILHSICGQDISEGGLYVHKIE